MKHQHSIAPDDFVILEKATRDGQLLESTEAMRRDIAESVCRSHNEDLTQAEKERGHYWLIKDAPAGTRRITPAKKSGKKRRK